MNRFSALSKMAALFFVTLTATYSLPAFADDQPSPLTTIRLDQTGGAFASAIPVYDQLRHSDIDGDDCYAIAASELIDAHRFRQNGSISTLTAPLSIALLFHLAYPKSIYKTHTDFLDYTNRLITAQNSAIDMTAGGDDEAKVFATLANQKACDQRFFNSFDGELALKPIDMTLTKRPFDDDSTENFLRQVLLQVRATQQNQPVTAESFFGHRLSQHQVDRATLGRALTMAALQDDPVQQSNVFTQQLCANHSVSLDVPPLSALPLRNATGTQQKQAFARINERLENGRPVAIFWAPGIGIFNFASEPTHESVIIGRRIGPSGEAEFLVRNSYGPNCQSDRAPRRIIRVCENGSEWLPAKLLIQTAAEISWLED